MKTASTILMFLICFSGYSQDSTKVHHKKRIYVPLSHYKKMGNTVTKKDSLNFMYRNNDTLVLMPSNYDFANEQEGIRVEYEPKDSLFLEIYKNVVFNNRKGSNNNATMKLWKDEIKIFFDSSVPKEHSRALMNFSDKISSGIDSLNISKVNTKEQSNFLVYYLNRQHNIDYEPRITNKSGGYYINWNGKQHIYKASVKINTEFAKEKDHQLQLLKYNFFKSLGYFKSSDILKCESYLSGCPVERQFTKMDKKLLKYHYSYGICKGVDLKAFEELHSSMQELLKKDPDAKLYVVHLE